MARYLIHCYKDRRWYVDKYLIPSMLEQDINESDIDVFEDDGTLGCLEAFVQSCLALDGKGTWHLQDDVIISSQFKHYTEKYADDKVVCGFCSRYCDKKPAGLIYSNMMWYSFPCIYIPDAIAKDFAKWYYAEAIYSNEYKEYILKRKFDDDVFMSYLQKYHADNMVLNLTPNLVNHIDYLLGGSIVNQNRENNIVLSRYWDEPELLKYWEDTICQ